MLKRRSLWIAVPFCLLLAGGVAAMLKKPDQPTPSVATATAVTTPTVMEFLPSDIAQSKASDLRQLLPLSGSLRALNQASVKARIPGEIREVLVREGETVTAGQVLIRMDTRDYRARLDQATGALAAARGQLDIATNARDNNQALLNKGFISRNAFDNAQSQFEIARANVESARGAHDVAQKALADTVIRAPISGLVSSRMAQPGEKVAADNRLLEVVDLTQMELEAAVPASDIMHVALDQEVQVKVEGLPEPLEGKVVRINPATQSGSRSIMTYIQIPNPQGILRVGMFGEAQLTTAKKADVLTLPLSAIRSDGGASFVYAIENSKLVRKPVKLGMRGNDDAETVVEIVQGLEHGAQIVKTNLGSLRTGTLIKVVQNSDSTVTAPAPTAVSAAIAAERQ